MKRYFAFYGECYYPSAAMGDFIGDFDTEKEAIEAIEKKHLKENPKDEEWRWVWAIVWDSETGIESNHKHYKSHNWVI